jgi:hypothetical protein
VGVGARRRGSSGEAVFSTQNVRTAVGELLQFDLLVEIACMVSWPSSGKIF